MERATVPAADVIDLADVFRSIKNGWLTVLSFTLIGVVAATAVILYVSPTFSGKASIVLKTGNSGNASSTLAAAIGSLADAGGGGGGGSVLQAMKPGVETEVEILQSRALVGEIVDSLALQAQITKPRATAATRVLSALSLPGSFKQRQYTFSAIPAGATRQYRFTAIGDSGIATIGQPTKLAVGTIAIASTAPTSDFNVMFRDHEDATTRTLDNLKFDKMKADIAHFEYLGDDSLSAAAVPNLLVDLYLLRRKGVDRGVNQRTAEFLAKKVDSVGGALTTAERALRTEREANGVVNPIVVGQAEFENENRLRQQLTDIQTQERALQQLVGQVRDGTASARQLASYPQYLGSGPINNIVSNLISVETERAALLGTVTEQDERVKALATRAKGLDAQLMPLAQSTLTALASERTSIEQRIKAIQESVVGMPREAESYGRLEREVVDLGKIYAGLQVKLVDQRLAAITEGGDVRPLDLAVPPKKPAFPKKALTLAGGFGGGLFVGLIVAVLLGVVGGRMHNAQDVERRMGLPAVRLETTAPLLVGGQGSRTVLVAPINHRALAQPVAQRLVETALSRSISATLLDLSSVPVAGSEQTANVSARLITTKSSNGVGFDANAAIRRLEESHDLVVGQLPALTSHEAAAVLDVSRPVLLVAPERRIDRNTPGAGYREPRSDPRPVDCWTRRELRSE